jgi:hypothetical protein
VFDNDHRVVSQKGSSSGRFTFSAADSGDHKICFTPTSNSGSTGWLSALHPMGGIKLTLDLAIGETSAIESTDKGKIDDIVKRVKDLNGRLQDIRREQVFQRVGPFYYFLFRSRTNLWAGIVESVSNTYRPFYAGFHYFKVAVGCRMNRLTRYLGTRGGIQRSIRIHQRPRGQMELGTISRSGYHLCMATLSPTLFLHQAKIDVERDWDLDWQK